MKERRNAMPREQATGPDAPAMRRLESRDPLAAVFANVAAGVFPPADGTIDVLPSPEGPVDALIALTGRHIIAADIDPAWVAERLRPGDFITPMSAHFIGELAAKIRGRPVVLDALLCAPSGAAPSIELSEVDALREHPRVAVALAFRVEVRVFVTDDGNGLLTVGRGLAGRWEASFEVEEPQRQRGLGRALASEARRLVPPGDAVFMQIAPGNAASLRAALAAGYQPVGSEILFLKEPG
jgi:GNAT superfamily N-acetyltransferase